MEELPGVAVAATSGGDSTDLLDMAVSLQERIAPTPLEHAWGQSTPLVAEDWPGIDLDLASVRQLTATEMLADPAIAAMVDLGAIGAGVLAEAPPMELELPAENRSEVARLAADAAHFPLRFTESDRVAFTEAARHLGLQPGETLGLRVMGSIGDQKTVALVRDVEAASVRFSSKGRLCLNRSAKAFLCQIWGLAEVPDLTLSGPGTEALGFIFPNDFLTEVIS